MNTMVNLALTTALQKREGKHDIINQIGKGIVGYWTGATLNLAPTPIIPATGTIQNITTTSAIVSKPGTFPNISPQVPTSDSARFLDQLILAMKIHLLSIEGIYNTISLYPGFPTVPPAPGILLWKGFSIPDSRPTPPTPNVDGIIDIIQEPTIQELLDIIPDDNNTVEGSRAVVQQTGRHILSDEDIPSSPQLERIKAQLPEDATPAETNTPTEVLPDSNEVQPIESQCGIGLNYNANLSQNFLLRNLSLDATFPHKIKQQHGLTSDDIVCNLETVALNLLEPIKRQFPNVIINSAFRGTPSLPGDRISQHEKGEAIDIQFSGVTPLGYLPIAKWIVENTSFDQLIFEHGNSIWLHVSTKRTGTNRKTTLTMYKGRYEAGIKCYYNT